MKRLIGSLAVAGAGVVLTLAGLGVDAVLHARDASLAEREGVFTLSNPGHALLALGIALSAAGTLAAFYVGLPLAGVRLFGNAWLRRAAVAGGVATCVAVAAFVVTVPASGHDHGEETVTVATASGGDDGDGHAHESEGEGDDAGHSHGPPSEEPTTADIACGEQLVADTKQALARFEDFDVAVAEGYRANPAKPNATHYGNPAYRLDGKVMDLAHPESLVYFTRPSGEKVLGGAVFVMPKGQSGPTPCGPVTWWHTHENCWLPGRVEGDEPVDGACPAGQRYTKSAEMMHVWTVPAEEPIGGSLKRREVARLLLGE